MIKFGILGAGRVVQNRYVEFFRDELKNAKTLMVCDIVQERAEKVANALGAQPVYDLNQMIQNKGIDVIVIATESGNHYNHAKRVLSAGKHVITEKPPTFFTEEVLELEQLAKEKGLMYGVVFQNRLNPAMKILKQSYDQGRFGKKVLSTIRLRWCRYQDYYEDGWHGTWALDGGVINQQAIHHLDALQWICGPIVEVFAMQSNALNDLEAEDTTVATVRFQDGSLGVIEATTAARPDDFEASMSIVGEKGFAVINGIALNLIETWKFVDPKDEDESIPEKYSQDVPTGYGLSHGPLFQIMIDNLSQGIIDPPIKGGDTVSTLQLVHALYRSSEINAPVKMDDGVLSERLGKQKALID